MVVSTNADVRRVHGAYRAEPGTTSMYCTASGPSPFQWRYAYSADETMVAPVNARVTGGMACSRTKGDDRTAICYQNANSSPLECAGPLNN
jgi:hypothetical protein